jgi:hypothetical protein
MIAQRLAKIATMRWARWLGFRLGLVAALVASVVALKALPHDLSATSEPYVANWRGISVALSETPRSTRLKTTSKIQKYAKKENRQNLFPDLADPSAELKKTIIRDKTPGSRRTR